MGFNRYLRNNGAIIICGIVIGTVALVPLRIAGRLIEIYVEVSTSLIYMLTPYFSSINSDKNESLNKSFQISVAAASFVSTLIFVNMCFLGEWFLTIWLGQVPEGTFEILIALAAGYCFANAQAPCTPLMISKDKNDHLMWLSILEITVLLTLIYPLIDTYGVIGSAYATFISLVIARGILQPILITRTLQISFVKYFSPVFAPMIATAMLITGIHELSIWVHNISWPNDILMFLLLQTALIGFVVVILIRKFKSRPQTI